MIRFRRHGVAIKEKNSFIQSRGRGIFPAKRIREFRKMRCPAGLMIPTLLAWAVIPWPYGVLGWSSWAQPGPSEGVRAFYYELAKHYAPVIYQGAVSDQDYIAALDFDGDWIGNNNWENQPRGDLAAYVYYSVIESRSHWFLFYSLFHPRDYTYEDCATSGGCHENDLESVQLVVEKDGTPFGRLVVLETLAHDLIYLYTCGPSVRGNFLRVAGEVKLEGDHPVIYVEAFGHGIYGHKVPGATVTPRLFGGGTVIYRVGEKAEVPEGLNDQDVAYRLLPIFTSLWPRRDNIGNGKTFDRPFEYRRHVLPAAIDGDNFGEDRANTPWGYYQATGITLSRGDWFLDPVKALAFHAVFTGDFSPEYLYNPYLLDLGLLGSP